MHALQKTQIRKGRYGRGDRRPGPGQVREGPFRRPAVGKVVVEKLNMIKRHTKPNQKVKQGGILEREAPLAISNVMFLCPVTKKPTRLGIRVQADGRRVRFSKKSNELVE